MTEFLLICLSSSYMYIFSYIFILKHREESVRTIVTVLAGFSLTCVDVAISAG